MTGFIELVLSGVVSGLVIGLAALSVSLVFGVARFPNAATGDIMTLAAYAALGGAAASGSILIGGGAGALAGAGIALATHALVFRKLAGRSSVSGLLASIGVAFVLRAIAGVAFGHQQQTFATPILRPWRVFDVRVAPVDLWVSLAALATLAAVFALLHFTAMGRRMRAVADDPALARVSGVSPARVMIALWATAGAAAGVAGMLAGVRTVVSPEMGWEMLLPAFAAAVLGGIGHPVGAVVAGVLLGVAQEVATPFVGFTYKIALAFLVLLAVLLLRPRGLFGVAQGAR